ncbi:hypothetical protein [Streptomyces sp. NPDC055060]
MPPDEPAQDRRADQRPGPRSEGLERALRSAARAQHQAARLWQGPLENVLSRAAVAGVEVGRRPLPVDDELTGTGPFTTNTPTKEAG